MSSHPVLIIALGGTGKEVAKQLRMRLQLAYGDNEAIYDATRFLYIDTDIKDNEAFSKYQSQAFPLTVSREVLADLQKYNSYMSDRLKMNDWFEPVLRQKLTGESFEGGVRGVRMYGRLALLASSHLNDLRQRLVRDILELRKVASEQRLGSLLIFVVASGGGGTGSGIFIDIGYMIADAIRESNISKGMVETEGIAAIAAVGRTKEQTQFRNSVALVQELDHFCQPTNVFEAPYGNRSLPEDLGRDAPYQLITLVAPTQLDSPLGEGYEGAMRELEHKIANYIFMRLSLHGGTNAFVSRLQDMRQNFASLPSDNLGYPNRYTTFGVALRQFPIGLYRNLATSELVQEILRYWLKRSEDTSELIDPQALKESASLSESYTRDLQALRDILALRPPHLVQGRQKRPPQDDPLFMELCKTNSESLVSVLQTKAQTGKVDEAFQKPDKGVLLTPLTPGYIVGTIEQNREQMMAPYNPNNRSSKMRTYLLDICFDPARGPRYALRLTQEIGRELQEEVRFIDEILVEGTSRATTAPPPPPKPAEKPKDRLLGFWKWLLRHPVAPAPTPQNTQVADRANRLFEQAILQARKVLYSDMQDNLTGRFNSVETQIKNLLHHTRLWGNSFAEKHRRERELIETLQYDTLYDKDSFALQIKMLQASFDLQRLIVLKQRLFEGSLPNEVPRNNLGEADFSLFNPLEQFFEESFEVMEINGTRVQDNLSILRLIAQAQGQQNLDDIDRKSLQELSYTLTREGLPLLNLRLDTVGYGELLTDQQFSYLTVWQSIAYRGKDRTIYDAYQESMKRESFNIMNRLRVNSEVEAAEHDDPSMLATLFVRGAFPSHIIVGYSHDDRERTLNPDDATGIVTAFTQKNIHFIASPAAIAHATKLLIIGEALRADYSFPDGIQIDRQGADHVFTYTISTGQSNILSYPKGELSSAVMVWAHDTYARQQLELHIRQLARNQNQRGAITTRIMDCTEELRTLINQKKEFGYYRRLDLGEVNYQDIIHTLERWLFGESGLELNDNELMTIHPWATLDALKENWVCRTCDYILQPKKQVPAFDARCPNRFCASNAAIPQTTP